jgi:hypothetical protein
MQKFHSSLYNKHNIAGALSSQLPCEVATSKLQTVRLLQLTLYQEKASNDGCSDTNSIQGNNVEDQSNDVQDKQNNTPNQELQSHHLPKKSTRYNHKSRAMHCPYRIDSTNGQKDDQNSNNNSQNASTNKPYDGHKLHFISNQWLQRFHKNITEITVWKFCVTFDRNFWRHSLQSKSSNSNRISTRMNPC